MENNNKYNGLLDKLLAEAAEKKARARFHYSAYWDSWSLTLVSPHIHPELMTTDNEYVELNLTPVNGEKGDWDLDIEPIVFRSHHTYPDRRDMDVEELPANVLNLMKEKLGKELTEMLLNYNFLAEIDLNKLRSKMSGGGVCLEEIKKDEAEESINE